MEYVEDNDYRYSLVLGCSGYTKCLVRNNLKREFPWVVYVELPDGTVVATGSVIKDLKYSSPASRKIKRWCKLCKSRRTR